ncbi:conserved hypothetical protein [Pseudomonas protegens Pf-5]|uniref:HNH nuclease domain-containing protein n=2 Tax=Pseudomonas protegens TaxID=380021 RepID=Q4KCG5_PSEF5|nr:conserved hypothetical protein [Pseudomonas protegens Pf-5]
MLKPIEPVGCSAALRACQNMMHMFALWLCQPTTRAAQLTAADLQTLPLSLEESRWLWGFLNKKLNRHKLLERAAHLAELNDTQKDRLRDWINATSRIGRYFEAAPIAPAMPVGYPFAGDPYAKAHQKNLQDLMEAFYNKGLKDGLPYLADGTPTGERSSLLKYQHFCDSFLALHKGDKDQDARHVCVMCGGELRNVEVDHWIPKSAYPLLAVCAENLVPICGECNGPQNKAAHPVHSGGSFEEWFHPYRRNPAGTLKLEFNDTKLSVMLKSTRAADAQRVHNLNRLLHLEDRWTRELKGENRKLYKSILTRQRKNDAPTTTQSLYQQVKDWTNGLSQTEPNYEVHQALAKALCDPRRIAAWKRDLDDAWNEDRKKPLTT